MIKKIILLFIAATAFLSTGCSYVSDMIEGAITDRASFSAHATYSGGVVTITWDDQDTDSDYFAGIEIYITKEPNDEYSEYITIGDQFITPLENLDDSGTVSFTYNPSTIESNPLLWGKYFFRVAYIDWDDALSDSERTYGEDESDYESHTNISAISGYAEVEIP